MANTKRPKHLLKRHRVSVALSDEDMGALTKALDPNGCKSRGSWLRVLALAGAATLIRQQLEQGEARALRATLSQALDTGTPEDYPVRITARRAVLVGAGEKSLRIPLGELMDLAEASVSPEPGEEGGAS